MALKAERGDEATFLAGGQSLIPAMKLRLAQPEVLIDALCASAVGSRSWKSLAARRLRGMRGPSSGGCTGDDCGPDSASSCR
ncbi:MAG: FAD binding domain-containing protein [Deltaproteobacteria bacterium]|nr:FAD binding domain-containing protein [Deltaproteobacteria bacterium]